VVIQDDDRRQITFDGHYWLDPGAFGSLAHLVAGARPAAGGFHEARARCGRTIAGEAKAIIPVRSACARCVDAAMKDVLREQDAVFARRSRR
jgi:bacterioferritin-associated ferredoxin